MPDLHTQTDSPQWGIIQLETDREMRLSFIVANIVSANIDQYGTEEESHRETGVSRIYRASRWRGTCVGHGDWNLDIRVRQSDGMSPHTRTDDSAEFLLTGLVVWHVRKALTTVVPVLVHTTGSLTCDLGQKNKTINLPAQRYQWHLWLA